jgi:hypothetical protein
MKHCANIGQKWDGMIVAYNSAHISKLRSEIYQQMKDEDVASTVKIGVVKESRFFTKNHRIF